MQISLMELVTEICESFTNEDRIQPGHNGPYNDPETIIRNAGHWLISFAILNKWNSKKIYNQKIKGLADILVSEKYRPHGFSFDHRNKDRKDRCNGLVGQSWTIESLYYASESTMKSIYKEVAEDLILQHDFDQEEGLWYILEIDGGRLAIDNTFNHQLWFASSCSYFLHNEIIHQNVERFLDKIFDNHTITDTGLILHGIEREFTSPTKISLKKKIRRNMKKYYSSIFQYSKTQIIERERQERLINKSIGYQSFNTYALATLKQNYPNHNLWKSEKIDRYVEYLLSDDYKITINTNLYAFPYNAPGFEIPYSIYYLSNRSMEQKLSISEEWISKQFAQTFNKNSLAFDRNTCDPHNLTARIYELLKLPKSFLESISITIQ